MIQRVPTWAAIGAWTLLGLGLRVAWPLADPATRFSWSNGIYSDPPTLAIAARNAHLFGQWIVDYNRDLLIYPLVNALTWLAYVPAGPGRLPSVLLSALAGAVAVGALAWGLSRALGPRAALYGAILGATNFWLVMFSRIPVAENVVVALLSLSAAFVISRGRWSQVSAGALAVAAVLFGKYHAIGYLPALLALVWLRERSVRRVLPLLAGGTAVALAWLVFIFAPDRATVLEHVQAQSTGLHGRLPFQESLGQGFGELLNTLRRSWMFYRMPVLATVGSAGALWILGSRPARRAAVNDGSAIYSFWMVGMWVYLSLLAYQAPRYYVLVGVAFAGAAAMMLHHLATAKTWTLRGPSGWLEHVVWLGGLNAFFFGVIDAVKHYASMTLEYLTLPPPRISKSVFDFFFDFFGRVDSFYQNLAWGTAFALIAYLFLIGLGRRGPRAVSAAVRGRFVTGALTVAVGFGLAQYAWWASHRTTFLQEVKSSLPAMLGPDPVLLGPMAPLVTQDTSWAVRPYFGPPERPEILSEYGISHVVICGPGEARQFEERFPGLLDETTLVQSWPVQTLFSSTLEVRRLPRTWAGNTIHGYEPSSFERGAGAVAAQDWSFAREAFAEYRTEGGEPIPELLSLESVTWFKLGDYEQAEKLLREAIALRPRDPLNYQNLAVLALRQGDRAAALGSLMQAVRFDPRNPELERMIQELTR